MSNVSPIHSILKKEIRTNTNDDLHLLVSVYDVC